MIASIVATVAVVSRLVAVLALLGMVSPFVRNWVLIPLVMLLCSPFLIPWVMYGVVRDSYQTRGFPFTGKFTHLQFRKHGISVQPDGQDLVLHCNERTPLRLAAKQPEGVTAEAYLRKVNDDVRQWLEATP